MITENVTHDLRHMMDTPSPNTTALYIGLAGFGPARAFVNPGGSSSHQYLLAHLNIKAGRGMKYQIARTGTRTTWIPITLINKSDNRLGGLYWADFLHTVELTFVNLFRFWNPLVLRTAITHEMGSYARDYETADIFKNLIDGVSAATGWNPAPTLGCNCPTPVFSYMPEDRVWISWYDTERQHYPTSSKRESPSFTGATRTANTYHSQSAVVGFHCRSASFTRIS